MANPVPQTLSPPPRPAGRRVLIDRLKQWSLPVLALLMVVVVASQVWSKLRSEVWAYYTDDAGTRVEVWEGKARPVLWEDPKPVYFQSERKPDPAETPDPANLPGGRLEAAVSADGTRMILVRWNEDRSDADLCETTWDGRIWSEPKPLASINTKANERSPGLSRDGSYLYFASDREGGAGGFDLYVARWDGKEWTGVASLGTDLNSTADDSGPAVSADDSKLYFSSRRGASGSDDIFVARRLTAAPEIAAATPATGKAELPPLPVFAVAEPVGPLNSKASELRATLPMSGDQVVLSSDRDRNASTGFGVYVSRVVNGQTLPPERIDLYVDQGDVTDPETRMDGFDLLVSADAKASAQLQGGAADEDGYRLFRSTTREVLGYTDLARWEQFKLLMDHVLWRLLLALAALAALIYLLEHWQDITSLFHKCLAGSAAVHLLLLMLMMIWQISQSLETDGEPAAAEIAISIDALAQEQLALESQPEEAEMADTNVAMIAPKLESDFVIPESQPVQVSAAPPIVTSTAKDSMIADVRPSQESTSSADMRAVQRAEQSALASTLPESLLPEPDLPEMPELAADDSAAKTATPADPSKDVFRPTASISKVSVSQSQPREVIDSAVRKMTETAEVAPGSATAATTSTGGDQIVAHAGLEAVGAPPKLDGSGTVAITLMTLPGSDPSTDPLLPGELETANHDLDAQALTKLVKKQRGRPSIETIEALGGSEGTEKAIGSALDWLVLNQEADGRWDTRKHGAKEIYDTAGTAAALLCFYGWGLNHTDGGKYQPNIKKAVDWLVSQQTESGELSGGVTGAGRMYCHGIATIALCEAYGISKDPKLREPAEKAIALILASQSPTKGGWRYSPVAASGVPSQDSDTSVTGWQYMALHSAKMADIEVPESTFTLAGKWFDRAGGGKYGGLYGYEGPAKTTPAIVATGMFCRQLDLVSPSDPKMQESADLLAMHPMHPARPDFYHVYYATLALYQHQGPAWLAWNKQLKEILPLLQKKDGDMKGSWDPAGSHIAAGGRVISTAFATLSLEVYYRLLPMYGFRNQDAPPAARKDEN